MKRRTRVTKVTVMVAAAGLALALSGAAIGSAAKKDKDGRKGVDPALVKKLKDGADGSVTVSTKKSTRYVGFVRAGQNGDLYPKSTTTLPEAKATAFLAEYADLFGIEDPAELVKTGTTVDAQGATHISYQQVYRGVPVFGVALRVHLDAQNDLTAANGIAAPGVELGVSPRLGAGRAAELAIADVAASPPDDGTDGATVSADDLQATSTSLVVYRTGLVRGVTGTSQLAYEVKVTDGRDVQEVVFVHAHAGKVMNRYSEIHDALFRRLFEQNTSTQVWQEGDAFPGALNIDQQNIVNFSGDSYRYFFNAFGRDSYDAAGAEMRSVNNDPTIACPNANWNGATTNYCNGVTADDVVAHEWGHAYTEFTHNLIYQWQPGALNESYSDIWGETVDMLNGAGTDSPAGARADGACTTHTPGVPELRINTPTPGICAAGSASFGPPLTATGVTGNLVLVDDGVADPSTSNGCTAFVNGGAMAGNIALVDRGICGFTVKVKNAQNAGAIAVVVADNVAGPVSGMGGADATITIPSLRITLANGNLLKGYLLSGGANVTLKLKGAGTPQDSYRWLMGEDATAFGSAIRDMWNPTCLSDPGKVTDAEYFCATSDGGGVHTNSGVPNHGYALLVDGGTYNGQTVAAIGLTRAAHLYFRAQSVYQTPTTDFDDHADALETSCSDLIGVPLEGLSTSSTPAGPSGLSISSADCAAVSAMIAAVELRTDPTSQCNFQPLLNQNTPALCANQKNPPVIYEENFEDGLVGWTLTNEGVFTGWPGTNWAASSSLPDGRPGSAAFGEDTDAGNCDGGAGDISGVMRLESPAIKLPAAGILSPRVTFKHNVATETGWDGGNVKISINGGPYTLVPASAFLFNPYNATINTAAAGNTNPLKGQPGFTGTDGGQVTSKWGESQIDLTLLGVVPGDTIRLRFDMGMDGCSGVDGWYVDDVKVRACNTKKNLTARKD